MRLPARIEIDQRVGAGERREVGRRRFQRLRLDGEKQHLGRREPGERRIDRNAAFRRQRRDRRRRLGLDDRHALRREAAGEPAAQQRLAHLARPDQDERLRPAFRRGAHRSDAVKLWILRQASSRLCSDAA